MNDFELTDAPLIGLPCRMDPGSETLYLSSSYSEAVIDAGGVPTLIPLTSDPYKLSPLIERLDGILLTGSDSDVDPALYNAQREAACGPVQPLRERTDFHLLETAFKRKLPVLAICFGMQSLNVYRGGTLIQDIQSRIQSAIRHNDEVSGERPCHDILIERGSVLEELAGGFHATINSTHHQAVDRIGQNLSVIARAPDGIIESIAGTAESPWILGVQWHPEKCFRYDRFSRELFRHFLARCRAARVPNGRLHSSDTVGDRRGSES